MKGKVQAVWSSRKSQYENHGLNPQEFGAMPSPCADNYFNLKINLLACYWWRLKDPSWIMKYSCDPNCLSWTECYLIHQIIKLGTHSILIWKWYVWMWASVDPEGSRKLRVQETYIYLVPVLFCFSLNSHQRPLEEFPIRPDLQIELHPEPTWMGNKQSLCYSLIQR